jgi:hypothetical protein
MEVGAESLAFYRRENAMQKEMPVHPADLYGVKICSLCKSFPHVRSEQAKTKTGRSSGLCPTATNGFMIDCENWLNETQETVFSVARENFGDVGLATTFRWFSHNFGSERKSKCESDLVLPGHGGHLRPGRFGYTARS